MKATLFAAVLLCSAVSSACLPTMLAPERPLVETREYRPHPDTLTFGTRGPNDCAQATIKKC